VKGKVINLADVIAELVRSGLPWAAALPKPTNSAIIKTNNKPYPQLFFLLITLSSFGKL
jgi:hypothetical protein